MFNQFHLNEDYYFEINGNEFDFLSTMHVLAVLWDVSPVGLEKSLNFPQKSMNIFESSCTKDNLC